MRAKRHVLMVLLAVSAFYFIVAALFAFKAIERRGFATPVADDIALHIPCSAEDYEKGMIAAFVSCTVANYDLVNDKVTYMATAHIYFKKALLTVALTAAVFVAALGFTGFSPAMSGNQPTPTPTTITTSVR